MLDFNRFEILTFDCYGTLINWEAGILPVLHRILDAHGKKVEDPVLLKMYGDFELLSEQGEFHPYRTVLESVVRRLGAHFGLMKRADLYVGYSITKDTGDGRSTAIQPGITDLPVRL